MANELVELANTGGLQELPVGRYIYTGNPRSKAEMRALAQAVQTKPPSLVDQLNAELEIVNLLFHRIFVTDDDTGEVRILPRMVVFCTDGKVYSTSGQKAIKDALLPAQLFGFELPYKPPQRFKVTRTKVGSDGRAYINLEWLCEGAK